MQEKTGLIVSDCDGTLEALRMMVFAYLKKQDPSLTPSKFLSQHAEQNALLPGMDALIEYTATLGNNVLLSGGDPENNACKEVKNLFPYFKNWKFDGKDVPFGQIPEKCVKETPELAAGLKKAFNPSLIIVIGNEECDAVLAKNIHADIFMQIGKKQTVQDAAGDVPYKIMCSDTQQAVKLLQEAVKKVQQEKLTKKPHIIITQQFEKTA